MDKDYLALVELFRKQHATTKEEIIERIRQDHKKIMEHAATDILHSTAFYHTVDNLFEKFENAVMETILFEKLEDCWMYDYGINYSGAVLTLVHVDLYSVDDEGIVQYMPDQEFILVETNTRLLSVEEYGEKYKVENGTVRQWIRRGKIRNAVKIGSEWKIPELTDPPQRGYTSASYSWQKDIQNIPEEYKFMLEYDNAFFYQDEDDKSLYRVSFMNYDEPLNTKTIEYNTKDRERFEMFMISHPQIRYIQNFTEGIIVDLVNIYKQKEDIDD